MKLLNYCIVCYKNVNSSPSPNKTKDYVTTRFIRLFQRHVKNFSLKSTKIRVGNSTLKFINRNGRNNEQVAFQTCASCSKMLSGFNSSYGDLKCAEMKINWRLRQLTNTLRVSDYAPGRRAKFKESVTDLCEDKHLTSDVNHTINKFRKQLRDQCRMKYNNQLPRVVLMKQSHGQTSTEHLCKNNYQQNESPRAVAKSKDALISTTLKNLNSLQLILYLALLDPALNLKTNVSNTNFEPGDSLEQYEINICSRALRVRKTRDHKSSIKCSPPSPPSPVYSADGDNGMEDEWNPGDGEECSGLDAQGADSDPIYYTTCGCEKRFDSEVSLRDHELQCQNQYDTLQKKRRLKDPLKDYGDSGDDGAIDKNNLGDETPSGSGCGPPKNYTEYHIKIIKNFTTQICTSCEMEFDSEKEFQQHLVSCSKTRHGSDAISISNVEIKQEPIEITNATEGAMQQNTMHIEKTSNKFPCDECGQRYKSAKILGRHKLIHLGPAAKIFSCSFCDKKFITKQNMIRHVQSHTGEKPFKCSEDNCERTFATKNSMRDHQLTAHTSLQISNKYRCKQCGLECKNARRLRYHKQTHLAPEAWKHSCNYCGKKFIRKDDMKVHVRSHTGETPFKCTIDGCQVAFKHNQSLQSHYEKFHKEHANE